MTIESQTTQLETLPLPPQLRHGHPGLCYIDLLDILEGLRHRLQLPDFRSVDAFCYLNGRTRRAASITAVSATA